MTVKTEERGGFETQLQFRKSDRANWTESGVKFNCECWHEKM